MILPVPSMARAIASDGGFPADPLLRPSDSVRAQVNADGGFLVDINSELCFHVNPVGSIIWQAISEGATLSTLCARLVDAFPGLAPEVAARDAELFVNQLIDSELIVRVNRD